MYDTFLCTRPDLLTKLLSGFPRRACITKPAAQYGRGAVQPATEGKPGVSRPLDGKDGQRSGGDEQSLAIFMIFTGFETAETILVVSRALRSISNLSIPYLHDTHLFTDSQWRNSSNVIPCTTCHETPEHLRRGQRRSLGTTSEEPKQSSQRNEETMPTFIQEQWYHIFKTSSYFQKKKKRKEKKRKEK